MADLRQFADNTPDVGIPNPPVQSFAADTSGAERVQADSIRRQGNEQLAQSLVQAGAQTVEGVGAVQDRIAQERIISGESSGMIDNLFAGEPDLPQEERMTFQRIAAARQSGQISADQARAMSSSTLRQSVARNPRRASAYRAAHNEFFGDAGAGAGTFQATAAEEMQEFLVKQGWEEFNIDPRLFREDPVAWEEQFQQNNNLVVSNNRSEAILQAAETERELTQQEQRSVFPGVVNNILTNPESESYLPNTVEQVMSAYVSEDGSFNADQAVAAQRDLASVRISVRSQLREQFSQMNNDDFNNIYAPIDDFFENANSVATGEMSLDALQRENDMFRESAVRSQYSANPEAARAFVGLSSLIGDLDASAISSAILQRQSELARLILGSTSSIVDPTNPSSPFDNARSPADIEIIGRTVGDLSEGASLRMNENSMDPPTRNRVNQSIVFGGKAIVDSPSDVKASDYVKFFEAVSTGTANEVFDQETSDYLRDNFEDISSTYLQDTLTRWRDERREGTQISFDQETNRIIAVPEDPSNSRHRFNAQRMNRDMGGSNVVFRAMDSVLGESGVDVLTNSDVGRGILAISGIDVEEDADQEMSFADLPSEFPQARMAVVANKIKRGIANDRDITDMERWSNRYDLDSYNIPELQEALTAFRGDDEEEAVPENRRQAFTSVRELASQTGLTEQEQSALFMLADGRGHRSVRSQVQALEKLGVENASGMLGEEREAALGRILQRGPQTQEQESGSPFREQLIRHEGSERNSDGQHRVYLDSRGNPTVGYGHLVTEDMNLEVGDTISDEQAEQLLEQDEQVAEEDARQFFPDYEQLNPARQAVLKSMAFNLGRANLSEFVRTREALDRGNFDRAAEEMLDSNWANQVGRRATELAEQMRTGAWQ